MSDAFRRIAVLAHPQVQDGLARGEQVARFLNQQGVETLVGLLSDPEVRRPVAEGKVDLCIALGGDGTMLRAGHLCGPAQVPILGVNLGRFGFLIEVNWEEWQPALERLLAGEYWAEQRLMLTTTLHRQGDPLLKWQVVNEVVVSRGRLVRPVRLAAYVDDILLARYAVDGLIAATPTGSTAYALAAGGPILPPTLRNILLVPVAPHLSVDRAVVLDEGSVVRLVPDVEHQAVLSVDGQTPVDLEPGDEIVVQCSEHSLVFIRVRGRDYFYRNITTYMNWNPTLGGRP
ncbi:MAG TPA: NAD(+)/NADH kinase [Anaerolineae bacterium]|nr:NAD(+)/NADH kinase [Anaerolineae bacterium]HIQ09655.1 NAD(+)/NADH kinase [Anaerolineaceae bacterium]